MATADTAIPIITGAPPISNRGAVIPSVKNRASQTIPIQIAANKTLPFPVTGSQFYMLFSSAAVNVRPQGGSFNQYVTGTGEDFGIDNAFALLEIQNPNSFAVTLLLFVGFDTFIDRRLILATSTFPQVAVPVYDAATLLSPATTVNVPDLSGTTIQDINGVKFYAISRLFIDVYNLDSGAVYRLQKSGATMNSDISNGAVQPLTPVKFAYQGNFTFQASGGLNLIVSDVYTAIKA